MWVFITWKQALQQAQYFQQQSSRRANSNKRNRMRGSNHKRLPGGQSEESSGEIDKVRNKIIESTAARAAALLF